MPNTVKHPVVSVFVMMFCDVVILSAVLRIITHVTPILIHLNFRPQGLGKGLDSFPGTPATSFYDPQSPHSAR